MQCERRKHALWHASLHPVAYRASPFPERSVENDLMTPSMKVKRPQLLKHYQKEVRPPARPPGRGR